MPDDHDTLDEKYDFGEKSSTNTCKVISLEALAQIIERQKKCSIINTYANDIEILESIFNKVADENDLDTVKKINIDAANQISSIKLSDPGLYHAQKKNIHDNCNKMLILTYQKCIESHKQYFLNDNSLNEKQKLAMQYSNFCHNMMLIFDNCEDFLKEHHNNAVIKEMFVSGKSYNVTKICTLFSSRHVHPHIRRNFDVLIFTTHYEALNHFSTVSNGYDKRTRRLAELAIQRIFSSENGIVTYRKFAFFPHNNVDKFQCVLVDNL
jgi:hypothetical protein